MADKDELFTPSFSAATRAGTIKTSVFNLVSTICGGGVLSLPFAFQVSGWLLGTIFLLLTAAASDFTIYVLVSCSRRTGVSTFEDVAAVAFGPQARTWTMVLVILLTYLAVIAYTILLRDLLASLVEAYFISGELNWFEKNVVSGIACLLLLPACLSKQLTELKFLSFLSMLSIVILAIAVIVRSAQCEPEPRDVRPVETDFNGILHALPIYICTFVCHFNVLPLHGELKRPTRKRLHLFVHTTVIITALIYGIVGLTGYLYSECKGKEEGNILNAFSNDDHLINSGRVGLSITLLLSLPLIVVPCRDTLIRLLQELRRARLGRADTFSHEVFIDDGDSDDDDDEEDSILDPYAHLRGEATPLVSSNGSSSPDHHLQQPLLTVQTDTNPAANAVSLPEYTSTVLTVIIMVTDILLAFCIEDVTLVWDLLGSSVSIIIAFTIPCAAYLLIRTRQQKPVWRPQMVAAAAVLIVSTIVGLVCTGHVIYALASGTYS